jgi:hypothetical protein
VVCLLPPAGEKGQFVIDYNDEAVRAALLLDDGERVPPPPPAAPAPVGCGAGWMRGGGSLSGALACLHLHTPAVCGVSSGT